MKFLKLLYILLLYSFDMDLAHCTTCPATGEGSCASGGAIPFGTDKCLIISPMTDTWTSHFDVSCSSIRSNFGDPGVFMGFERVAVFTDNNAYYDAIKKLNSQFGPSTVWLGAKSTQGGTVLSDYCWMDDQTVPGSQVSTTPIPVKITTTGQAYCLYIDTATPDKFYADDCDSIEHLAICEIGCQGTNQSPATCSSDQGSQSASSCGTGTCNLQGNSASVVTMTTKTTKASTLNAATQKSLGTTASTLKSSSLTSKANSITTTSTTSLTKTTQFASSSARMDTAANVLTTPPATTKLTSSSCPISTLCASYDGVLGSDGKCYVLFRNTTGWDIGQQRCGFNNFADSNRPVYGRTAVFTDSAVYYNVISQINANTGPATAWIGAQTTAPKISVINLADFCWMVDQTTVGSQATLQQIAVPKNISRSPACLFISTADPTKYYADECNLDKPYYVICEFGCANHGDPNPSITCATGRPKNNAACTGTDACDFGAVATTTVRYSSASVSTSTASSFTASAATSGGATSIITTQKMNLTTLTISATQPSTSLICPTSGLGSCGSGGAIPFGTDKCLLITTGTNTWLAEYNGDCGAKAQNFGQPVAKMGYGRLAVFLDNTQYYAAMNDLNAKFGFKTVWLGAQAKSSGNLLTDYFWMTDQTHAGSRVSGNSESVNITNSAAEVCLYVDTAAPGKFFADDCTSSSYRQHLAICEIGCPKVTLPNATCVSGICNIQGDQTGTTAVATRTPTSATTTSSVPSITAIGTTLMVSSATSATLGSITTSFKNTPSNTISNLLTLLPLITNSSSSLKDSNQTTIIPAFSLPATSTPVEYTLPSLSLQSTSTVTTEFTSQLSQSEAPSTSSSTSIALVSAQSSSVETPVSSFHSTTAISFPILTILSASTTTTSESFESVPMTTPKTQELIKTTLFTSRSSSADSSEPTSALSTYSNLLSTTVRMTASTTVLAKTTGDLSSSAAMFSQIPTSITAATLEAVLSLGSTSAGSRPTSIARELVTSSQNEAVSSSASLLEATVNTPAGNQKSGTSLQQSPSSVTSPLNSTIALTSLAQSSAPDTASNLTQIPSDLPFIPTTSPTSFLAPTSSAIDLFSSSFSSYASTVTQTDFSSTQNFLAPSTVDSSFTSFTQGQSASTTAMFTSETNKLNTKTPTSLPSVALLETLSPNQLGEVTLYSSSVQSTNDLSNSRVTSFTENFSKGVTTPEIISGTIVKEMKSLPSGIFAFTASTKHELTLTSAIVAKSSQADRIRKQSTSNWLKVTKSSSPKSFLSQQAMSSDAALFSLESDNTGTNLAAAISTSYLTNVRTGSKTSSSTPSHNRPSTQIDVTSANPETADLVLIATGSKADRNTTTQSSPITNSIRKKKAAFTNKAAFASEITASAVSNDFAMYNPAVLSESQFLTTKGLQNTWNIQGEVEGNTNVQDNLTLANEQYTITSANAFSNTVPEFPSTVASFSASNNADRSDVTNFNDSRPILIANVTNQAAEVVYDVSTAVANEASLVNTKAKEGKTGLATSKQTVTSMADNGVSNGFAKYDATLSQNQIFTTNFKQTSLDSQSQAQEERPKTEVSQTPNHEQSTSDENIAQTPLSNDLFLPSNNDDANVLDLANQVATNNPSKTLLLQNYRLNEKIENAITMYSTATAAATTVAILYANQINQSQIDNPALFSSSTIVVDPENQNSIRESNAIQSNNSQLDKLQNPALAVTEASKNEQSQIANKAESEQSNNLTSSDNDNYSNLDIHVPDSISAENNLLQQTVVTTQSDKSPVRTYDTLQQNQNLISDKSSMTDDKANDKAKAGDKSSQTKGTESIKQNLEQDSNDNKMNTIQSNQVQNSALTTSLEPKDAQQNRQASSNAKETGDQNLISNDNDPATGLSDINLENNLILLSNTATLQADQSQFQTNTTLEQDQNPAYDKSPKTAVNDNVNQNNAFGYDNTNKDTSTADENNNLSDNAKQNENENASATEQNKTIFSILNPDSEAMSQTTANKLAFSNGYTNRDNGNSANKNMSNDDKRKTQETDALSDCDLLDWGPYSSCSATCGVNAVRVRQRKIDNLTSGIKSKCPTEESLQCNVPKCNPMTQTELLVSSIEMNIGCCWLMSTLLLSFIAAIIRRFKTYLPIVHANENISILFSHIIVMVFAMRDDNKFNHDVCKAAAIGLQYFYLVSFGFQFMEALYIYSVLTSVSVGNLMIGVKTTMGLCWGIPVVVAGFTAAFAYDRLMSDFTCWLNLGDHVFLATFLPVLALACPTAILLEAAGKEVPGASQANVMSCRIARGSLALVFSSHFASWFLGSSALYYQRIDLFTIVFGLNVTTGILIFFYHLFSDTKVRTLVKKICCRKTENVEPKLLLH